MAADAKPTTTRRDRGRAVYRLTGEQALRMIDAGIIPDGVDVELWDGVLYTMTKHEPHNFSVGVTADALRAVLPAGFHVREEKSVRHGLDSLPQPDVAVVRGPWRSYQTRHPTLHDVALVVEVCASTEHADRVVKPRRFAEVGIPVYWLIDLNRREVEVQTLPQGLGQAARYTRVDSFSVGQEFPVVLDGRELGRIAVVDILPVEGADGGGVA